MKKPTTLITIPKPVPCRIIKRLNRFTITIQLENGQEEPALIRNTGRLREILYPEAAALCIPRGKTGKTRYLLIGSSAEASTEVALIDPATQCRAFETAAARGLIPWLNNWQCKLNDVLSVVWAVFLSSVYIEWDGVLPPCYVEIRKREDTFPGCLVRSLPIFFGFELQVCVVGVGSIRQEKPHGCVEMGSEV